MRHNLGLQVFRGLGRSCEPGRAVGITSAPLYPGVERIEARFRGDAFAPHRHDTYALGVTLHGVQTFRYRGERWSSLPGNVIVLHPDELHDGAAGTEAGLRYRILYLEPSLLRPHLAQHRATLPFVDRPVLVDAAFRAILLSALGSLDDALNELFVDELLEGIVQALSRHARFLPHRPTRPAWRQAHLAREFLRANAARSVRSAELEQVTGLDRFTLSRQFRALFGTSPHRYVLLRRLERARRLIEAGERLAEIAADTGFADQSHLNRHFKQAFGLTPGRWAALTGGSAGAPRRRP
jgi:AraC-like DNA-binding protein